jgi:mRNA-degrading endonuclease RelE of RelBE toxin-antitoxin system
LRAALKKHRSVRDDLSETLSTLQDDYKLGVWIPNVGAEVRKIRVGVRKNRISKRDGYRLLYLVDREKQVITLLTFHFKPDIEVIPDAEVARLVEKLTKELVSSVRQQASTAVDPDQA